MTPPSDRLTEHEQALIALARWVLSQSTDYLKEIECADILVKAESLGLCTIERVVHPTHVEIVPHFGEGVLP